MATSIITGTTFMVATIFDYRAQATVGSAANDSAHELPEELLEELLEEEIGACTLAAVPRCGWSARTQCGHRDSCRS